MKRFYRLLPFFALGVAACLLLANRKASPPPQEAETVVEPVRVPDEVRAREWAEQQKETQTRVDALAKLETRQGLRERAEAKSMEFRTRLQNDRQIAWTYLLNTNQRAFHALRDKVALAPQQEIPCTICEGTGHLHFCIVCRDQHGKCVTCGGTGKALFGEYCPTCIGTGKCFLCRGTGKMVCPFCEGGNIYGKVPFPPNAMPVYIDTPLLSLGK